MTLKEDTWYEECSTCEGEGHYTVDGESYVCDNCDAQGYVEHICPGDLIEDNGS